MSKFLMSACAAAAAMMSAASAAPIVLDFEGIGNQANINGFYNGGTDSQGNSGTNFGIEFSSNALAIIDADAGGTGNFANEPSPSTILFFLTGSQAIMNVAAGFTTGFSFFYTSLSQPGFVSVFDGLNGMGNVLATINLTPNSSNCAGDPNGQFCRFDPIGVAFTGTAFSVGFGGVQNQIGFDNITFGSATPGGEIPIPAAGWLLLTGAGAMFASAKRRRKA